MPNVITSINDARTIAGAIGTWIHVNGSLTKNAFEQEESEASNMMFTLDRIIDALTMRPTYAPAISFWTPGTLVLTIGVAINQHAPCVCETNWESCLYPRWVEFIESYCDDPEGSHPLSDDPDAYEDTIIVLPTMRNDDGEDED